MITDKQLEIECECEGKTISTLSALKSSMIIRFTDGSILRLCDGKLSLENSKTGGTK